MNIITRNIGKISLVVYSRPLYELVIIMVVCILMWSFLQTYFSKYANKRYMWLWININRIMMVLSFISIFLITIANRKEIVQSFVLIPFYSFFEAKTQPEMYRTMFMNIILFFPLGLSIPFSISDRKRKVLTVLCFSLLLSSFIEITQYCCKIGRTEIDDVICNVFGGLLGTSAYIISKNKRLENSIDNEKSNFS